MHVSWMMGCPDGNYSLCTQINTQPESPPLGIHFIEIIIIIGLSLEVILYFICCVFYSTFRISRSNLGKPELMDAFCKELRRNSTITELR